MVIVHNAHGRRRASAAKRASNFSPPSQCAIIATYQYSRGIKDYQFKDYAAERDKAVG